jgi:hypothetical protein
VGALERWRTGLYDVVMRFTRSAAWTLALLLMSGCNSTKTATLGQGDKPQIPVTIVTKTGGVFTPPFVHALPSGTPVTILDGNSSDSTVKIRIEQGEFKGHEATVDRNAIHLTE